MRTYEGLRFCWTCNQFQTCQDCRTFAYGCISCSEHMVSVTPDGGMQILVRDAMYKKPLEEQYDKDYVATWKNYDKSTRPFRFSAELEDMQPVK